MARPTINSSDVRHNVSNMPLKMKHSTILTIIVAIHALSIYATLAKAIDGNQRKSLNDSAANNLKPCAGDTRGDQRCNHDSTHRVCARIGLPSSSFWKFTGQSNWCGTNGNYGPGIGEQIRCPESNPTWCICKWATASWISGEGCGDAVQFDCSATDVCDLKCSNSDFDVNLKPAHDCLAVKCAAEWEACPSTC